MRPAPRSATEAVMLKSLTWGQRLVAVLKFWVWVPQLWFIYKHRKAMKEYFKEVL